MDGILNIYKEPGYTSHDVVAKLRGILKQKKIGHTGTLDPAACGVLPVCLGSATKLCELMTDKEKEYEAVMRFGVATDTEDMTGTVVKTEESRVTKEALLALLPSFIGTYDQIPPMYSAVKVNGKKLYELAREGKVIERQARPVTIYENELLAVTGREDGFLETATLRIRCSKGTYIRSLLRDMGEALGSVACMDSLVRTRAGAFTLEQAVTLAKVEQARDAGRLLELLWPVDSMLSAYRSVSVLPEAERYLYNGNKLQLNQLAKPLNVEDREWLRIYDTKGRLTGLYVYEKKGAILKPEKMFLS